MPDTFVKIASVTVGSGGASSIDFTSIPSTYTDLVIKLSARTAKTTTVWDGVLASFNGSTANFSYRNVNGDGSSPYSLSASNNNVGIMQAAGATSNTFGNYEMYIPNYAGSANKSMNIDSVTENNATEAYAQLQASLWSNTSAITSISLSSSSTNIWLQYSTATLYGIKNS